MYKVCILYFRCIRVPDYDMLFACVHFYAKPGKMVGLFLYTHWSMHCKWGYVCLFWFELNNLQNINWYNMIVWPEIYLLAKDMPAVCKEWPKKPESIQFYFISWRFLFESFSPTIKQSNRKRVKENRWKRKSKSYRVYSLYGQTQTKHTYLHICKCAKNSLWYLSQIVCCQKGLRPMYSTSLTSRKYVPLFFLLFD